MMRGFQIKPFYLLVLLFFSLPLTGAHGQSLEGDLTLIRIKSGLPHSHTGFRSVGIDSRLFGTEEGSGHHTPVKASQKPTRLLGRNAVEKYNPVSLLLAGALTTYRSIISPQLSNRCIYHPSCSSFGRDIMQERGLLAGMFLTADRISRCNRVAAADTPYFRIDFERGLLLDETERYKK